MQRKNIGEIQFEFDLSDSLIRKMWFGIYEIIEVNTLKRYIRKGSTFIDVGANIGYMTAIGADCVGIEGSVHSFEPVPRYFYRLEKVKENNPMYPIYISNVALGEKSDLGYVNVSNGGNIGWNTMVPEYMDKVSIKEKIEVKVVKLDDYIKENDIRNISLIKIDVEGYEFSVLKGLKEYFGSHQPHILCEIAPDSYKLMGYTLAELKDFMNSFGYKAFRLPWSINGKIVEVDIASLKWTTNVIFMKSAY